MSNTVQDVLAFVEENDVKFIRLAFCDLFGLQKNISIMPSELPRAFSSGISFDANAIRGFENPTTSDLLLFPDPSTLSVLPWRPQQGRVARFLCDIKYPDGSEFAYDTRAVLKKTVNKYLIMGLDCKIGAECEFYLFKTDAEGTPTNVPLDNGGYLDMAPLDKGENVRREICLSLEELGIYPESSHHEQGPGQNEIAFRFSDPLSSADNLLTFKMAAQSVAASNGLYASFMPKPIPDKSGSGLHINISLYKNGINLLNDTDLFIPGLFGSFIAGVLKKIPEITAFLNPIPNSYDRLGRLEAPKYVSWSHQNRSQLIRIPAAEGENMRMELRSPDPASNPYLCFALIISAGLDGIERGLSLPSEIQENLYTADDAILSSLVRLPESLEDAVNLAKNSSFAKNVLGENVFNRYLNFKEKEVESYR